jgi:hypothetical protein
MKAAGREFFLNDCEKVKKMKKKVFKINSFRLTVVYNYNHYPAGGRV